jgi:hypothetical protein
LRSKQHPDLALLLWAISRDDRPTSILRNAPQKRLQIGHIVAALVRFLCAARVSSAYHGTDQRHPLRPILDSQRLARGARLPD